MYSTRACSTYTHMHMLSNRLADCHAGSLPHGQYTYLALVLRRSALPWLQQLGCAKDGHKPLPLALRDLVQVEAEEGNGLCCCLEVTRGVLALLLELIRCVQQVHGM